tara:strand:+ start:622 stop:2790 length:2169 start_codon:yes stop_codon:yes gene_type:complete
MVKSKLSVKQPDVPRDVQPSEQPVVPPTGQPTGPTSSNPDAPNASNVPNATDATQGISSDISEVVFQDTSEEDECKQLYPAITIKKILQNENVNNLLKENNIYNLINENILSEAISSDNVNIHSNNISAICTNIVDKNECLENGCQFDVDKKPNKCFFEFPDQYVGVHKSKILDNNLIEMNDDCSIKNNIIMNSSTESENNLKNNLTTVKDTLYNLINDGPDREENDNLRKLYEVISKQICPQNEYYDCKKDKCMDVRYIAIEKIKNHKKCTLSKDVNLDDDDFSTLKDKLIAKNNNENCDKYSDTDCENSLECKLLALNENEKKCIPKKCTKRIINDVIDGKKNDCVLDNKCVLDRNKCRSKKCTDFEEEKKCVSSKLLCKYEKGNCMPQSCSNRTVENCLSDSSNLCMKTNTKCIDNHGITPNEIDYLKGLKGKSQLEQIEINKICNKRHLRFKNGIAKDLINHLDSNLQSNNIDNICRKAKCEKKENFYYDQNNNQCINVDPDSGCKASISDKDTVDKKFIINAQKKCMEKKCKKQNNLVYNPIPYKEMINPSNTDYDIKNHPYQCYTRKQCFKDKNYQFGNQCIDIDECNNNKNTNNIKCVQYTEHKNRVSKGNDLRIHTRTRSTTNIDKLQEQQNIDSGGQWPEYNNLTWLRPQYDKKNNTTLQQCFDLCNNISNCKLFTYNESYRSCALKYDFDNSDPNSRFSESTGSVTYVKKQL